MTDRPRGGNRPVPEPAAGVLERLYVADGLSIATIAGRFGVGRHLVRAWLDAAGIATRPAGGRRGTPRRSLGRLPVPPAGELRELLLVRRLGRRALAAHYGVHPGTVSRWLAGAGLPARPPPVRTAAEVVARYRREAIPAAEVARRVGVSDTFVLRALHAAGIRVDPSRQAAAVRADAARRAAVAPLPAAAGDLAEVRYRDDGWSYRRIAESLSVPTGRVRRELARRGVPPRPRPVPGRAARQEAPVAELRRLYVDSQRSAEDVGALLDLPTPVVLRTGHAHGLPIRQGGSPAVSASVELIDGLYADPEVAAVLERHRVPRRPAGGGIAARFPEPVPLTAGLLADLYTEAGCSRAQIEVLTGQSRVVVGEHLAQCGIPVRAGHLSPALRRLRAAARARFLAGVLASYREHGSTAGVAAEYGCATDTARRWITAAGGRVPGRGRWAR